MPADLAPAESLLQTLPGEPPTELARLLASFRAELAARGVSQPRLYRPGSRDTLTCTRCFLEGAEALGYAVERIPGGEAGPFEAYESLSWHVEGASQGDPGRIERYAATTFGLIRLQRGDEEPIWLGSCEVNLAGVQWHEVLVAADDEAALVELLQVGHERHVGRKRKKKLLLFDGRSSEWVEAGEHAWEDVILPAGLREELQETIAGFFAAQELYAEHGIPHRRGVLLAGEPGNGKTSIVKVLGAQLDLPVVVASLNQVSPGSLRAAFERAQELAPAVLCFEDLDALLDDRGQRLSMFLNLLDGVVPLDGVLVIATTNRPDRIDPAISRRPSRFDRVFLIPQPEAPQREAFLARLLGDDAPAGSAARLAEETEGYSMAFLKELVLQARLQAVRRGSRRLTAEDLDRALENTREHLRLASQGLEERGQVGF